MKIIKLGVVGSRSIYDQQIVSAKISVCYALLATFHGTFIPIIVSGYAKGVDTCAENWAREKGYDFIGFAPDWKKYGHSAGFVRNELIVNECDALLCIWDGESKGAKHSYNLAKQKGKQVFLQRAEQTKGHDFFGKYPGATLPFL